MEKRGFHRWAWLVVFLLGGVLMLFGGAQDVAIFFSSDLALVPSWHPVPPLVGLVCGLIVLVSAGLDIVWGWQLRRADGVLERRLASSGGYRQRCGHDRRLGQRLLRLRQLDSPADWRLVDAKRLKLGFFCAGRAAQF